MERFHKFTVSIGLYNGDMEVTNGVRQKAVSHKWSVEHFILYNNKQDHWEAIKQNLINMYNDSKYRDGIFVQDLDGNQWAKQEHFLFDKNDKEKKKAVGINYDEVKEYVNKYGYRSNKKSIAAEGYFSGNKRLPLPTSGDPGVSNHITGDAIDINYHAFINPDDAIIDLIALNFGLVRCASDEQWHFERTDLEVLIDEQELIDNEYKDQES